MVFGGGGVQRDDGSNTWKSVMWLDLLFAGQHHRAWWKSWGRLGSIWEHSTTSLHYSGLLGVMSLVWKLYKGFCCQKGVVLGTRTFSLHPLSLHSFLWSKRRKCLPWLSPSHHSVRGVCSNLIGEKLASLASYLNRGCYCTLRKNGRVLLPSFASCTFKQVAL